MRQKRYVWMIAAIIGVLLGLGIGQRVKSQEATAAPQEGFAQLKVELNALKAQQRALQAEWQAELLAQVVPTLADESEKAKRQFVDFLADIGRPGTAALIAILQDPSEQIRQKAADKLGAIGERERKAKRNVDAIAIGLATALNDPSDKVFREALEELDDVRPTSPESMAVVIPALIAVRTRGSSETRADALDVLGGIGESRAKNGEPTDSIRDALIASLADESSSVRTNAIEELSDIRAASSETFTALTNALADKSKSVRNRAEDELIQLGKGAATTAIPILADGLGNNTSPVTRVHIIDVLGAIGEKGKTTEDSERMIVQALLGALQDAHEDVRRNAADELGEMRATSPDVLPALTNALDDNSQKVRNAAQKAIQRIEGAK
ncbi:MAG: HEAT repeat domain-containing protein [Candidatus Poribacteria bacterium]|nr:HEAT repeat domain-containing protein [Candidatus Poribacteria bacterium]